MSDDGTSRRRFLRLGSATALFGIGLSGCSGNQNGEATPTSTDGDDSGTGGTATRTRTPTATATETRTATPTETPTETTAGGSGTATATPPPGDAEGPAAAGTYRQWLYTPGSVVGADHYRFSVLDFTVIRANQDGLGDTYTILSQVLRNQLLQIGLEWPQASGSVSVGGGTDGSTTTVLVGNFASDPVEQVLTDSNYTEGSSTGGYAVYERTSEPEEGNSYLGPMVAVADGAVLSSENGRSKSAGLAGIRATIDAANGDVPRYAESSDDLGALVDPLGGGMLLTGGTNDAYGSTVEGQRPHFAGQVASGRALDLDGESATIRIPVVFESADAVAEDAVESWIQTRRNADEGQLASTEEHSVTTNGRVTVVTATGPTQQLLGRGGSDGRMVAPALPLGPAGGI